MTEHVSFLVLTHEDDVLDQVRLALGQAGLLARGRRVASVEELPVAIARSRPRLVVVEDQGDPRIPSFADLVRTIPPDSLLVLLCDPAQEQRGVQAMEAGFADYFLRNNLTRLGVLVRRWVQASSGPTGSLLGETDLHRAHAALLQLARSRAFQGDNLIEDLQEITEVAARALRVARASVWLYDATRSRIRCIDLYELGLERHSDGEELLFKDHPAYFLALEEQRLIVAHDARADSRTRDYTSNYLEPRGITSMLDAAVRQGGELRGVICLEHIGPQRRWTIEEEVFACAFADLVSLALEASERQTAEFALAESEARFREVFQNTSDAIAFFEVVGGRRYLLEGLNPAAETLLEVEQDAVRGRTPQELLPASVSDLVLRSFHLAVETGVPVPSEQRWELARGSRWIHSLVVPSKHPGQLSHRLAVIWRDISDHKAYEKALIDREEMFRRLVETTNVIPWEADFQTGRYTYVGYQAVKRFGYGTEEWYGESFWLDHLHPEDKVQAQQTRKRLSASTSEYDFEYRMLTQAGEVVWVHDLVNVVADRNGRLLLRGFLVDVTARRQAEEEIRRLNSELERRVIERTAQLAAANRELEAFCYSVSHDLRAPLRSIDGFSKALIEDYVHLLDKDGQDMLQRVRCASQRMGELIDDLLLLSRVSRGEMRLTRVNLSEMAQAIAQHLTAQAPDRQVEWVITPGLTAVADSALLRVVLENLIGNAWKYTGKKPTARIEIGLSRDEEEEFFVRDNGAGFDMTYAAKLFQPFQRLHRPEEFEGHGIGLATVQRIVHRHRGRVRAESEPGKGATFYFTL